MKSNMDLIDDTDKYDGLGARTFRIPVLLLPFENITCTVANRATGSRIYSLMESQALPMASRAAFMR